MKMRRTMRKTHLNLLHKMYFRVLYGEVNHRKEVSGRLQERRATGRLAGEADGQRRRLSKHQELFGLDITGHNWEISLHCVRAALLPQVRQPEILEHTLKRDLSVQETGVITPYFSGTASQCWLGGKDQE